MHRITSVAMVTGIGTIIFMFFGKTCGVHSNNLVRLPNPGESPHMKNQSFLVCTGEKYHDIALSVEFIPKYMLCGSTFAYKLTLTPKTDVLYCECVLSISWNGIVIYSSDNPGLCDDDRLSCPLYKGQTYTYNSVPHASKFCNLQKGVYKVTATCKDQNGQEIMCFIWNFGLDVLQ